MEVTLLERIATPATVPHSAALWQPDIESFVVNRYLEIEVDPEFLGPRLAVLRSGMKTITDKDGRGDFPFRTFHREAYGPKYDQEVGLKHETRDGENKWVFQFIRHADNPALFNHSEYGAFLCAFADIDSMACNISLALAEALDESSYRDLYIGSMRERAEGGRCVHRGLRYLAVHSEQAPHDAYPHGDRSLWSIHLGSSHNGLVLFSREGGQVATNELDNGLITVFLGRKFAAATRDTTMCCPHGVKTDRAIREDRYAFVSFFHPAVLASDVEWLAANDDALKAYEHSLTI